MKYITKDKYKEYLNTLDELELNQELNYLVWYKKRLYDLYDKLINRIKQCIFYSSIDNLYNNIVDLKFYLEDEIRDFLDNENIENGDKVYDILSEKTLIKEILNYYSFIFDIPKEPEPCLFFEIAIDYKRLNYSYYDALNKMSLDLLKLLNDTSLLVNEENFLEKLRKEIIVIAEMYSNSYIDTVHILKDLIDKEQFDILDKYNCASRVMRLITEHNILSIDRVDLKDFFEDTVITKIIDNNKEIILSNKPSNEFILITYMVDPKMDMLDKKLMFYKNKLDKEVDDYLFGLYYGNDNDLVIYTSKKK